VLFGLFFAHGRDGGPPHTTTEQEVEQRFSPRFELKRLVRAPDSFSERAGEELEVVAHRRRAASA